MRILAGWLAALAGLSFARRAMAEEAALATATDPQEAARLLADILADEASREALVNWLLGAAAEAGIDPPATDPAALLQLSLARQIADYTRELAERTAAFVASVGRSANDIVAVFTGERLVNWIEVQDAAWSLALVAAVTLGLFIALRWLSHRFFAALADRSDDGRWPFAVARLTAVSVVHVAVIFISWAAGHAFALAHDIPGQMDFRQNLFLNAFLLIELTKVAVRILLVPRHGRLRLLPMSDETAVYWYFWSSRLISLLGYGLMLAVPVVNAAVSYSVGRSLALLIVLTALLTAILIVLQNRSAVRAALCARRARMPEDVLARMMAWAGAVWHWVAIVWLIALFLVWWTSPGDALRFMLVATLQSAGAILFGVAATVLISRGIARWLHVPDEMRRSMPLLEARLTAFVPSILQVVRVLVAIGVVIAIGQAWRVFDFIALIASDLGAEITARALSALLVAVVALALWLGVSSFVEYRLNPETGRPPRPRERTLLSLFRNAFTVVLTVITTMLVLSQLGMNIAPLLAGAGVVGLAVGFGAQRLVQDVITGAFIQIENAMNEGDVVTVNGTSGVVERLTIRSVGLRDLSGTYHLIPFGSVDMVSNFMKGFGYHVAEIGVAYRENIAEVKALMQVAFDRLMETEHAEAVMGPFEMHGVTGLGDSAVTVRGRIKTLPGMHWPVGRAYTEIVKEVLDEAGVEIPFPHLTLYMGKEKDDAAPSKEIQEAVAEQMRQKRAPRPGRILPEPNDPAEG